MTANTTILCDVEKVILKAVRGLKIDDPCGLDISDRIFLLRGRRMALAVMYSALSGLEKKGLIVSRTGVTMRGGHPRIHFRATDLGKQMEV